MTKEKLISIFGSILVALAGWNLRATIATAEAVARMEERQLAAARIDEQHAVQIRSLDVAVTELRARVTANEIRLSEMRTKESSQR